MSPVLALARVTIAEAVRSRVALGLALGLLAAIAALASGASGDGTDVGSARAFFAGSVDATWALLALAAVFLSTTSLSRELEDGRAVPVAVTPVSPAAVLAGKWLGLAAVLGAALALALGAVTAVVAARPGTARSPEEKARIETEVLSSRAAVRPPKLERDNPSREVLDRATARLAKLGGALPEGTRPEDALAKLLQEEIVRALSVSPGHRIRWTLGPLSPELGGRPIALRYRYRVLGTLPPGKGPRGVFSLEVSGGEAIEKPIASVPDAIHEMPAPGGVLRAPRVLAPVDGRVFSVEARPSGELAFAIAGTVVAAPAGFRPEVSPGQDVHRGDALAASDRVWLTVTYENRDPSGVVVVFPPEGVEVLYADRSFAANVALAYALLLGRLSFLVALGLALSTVLDGKVAALATFFVLAVAAAHGFLVDAVGPIVAGASDNVFGVADAPIKALLRGVLFVLPDLGRDDPAEALAQGRDVPGTLASLVGLGVAAASGAIAAGSFFLGRRELAGGAP